MNLDEAAGLRGVISANDAAALGALEVMAEAGRSATITGMNAMPDAIRATIRPSS